MSGLSLIHTRLQEECKALQAECRKRENEIWHCQLALSGSREEITVERSNCLALQKANDNLRLQLRDQERQFDSLRQLCKFDANQCQSPSSQEALFGNDGPCLGCASGSVQSLADHVEALHLQLSDQEQSSCERIQALQEDRVVFLEDANNHRDMLLARVQALQGQLTEAEDGVLELTNSLEAAWKDKQEALQETSDAKDGLKLVVEEKDKMISSVESRAKQEIEAIRKAKSKQAAELNRKLREQGIQLVNAEEHSLAVQTVHSSQLEAIESRVYKSKGEAQSLQMRRVLDMEGWANDIASIRRRQEALEKKLLQAQLIRRLPDDERLDALLESLDRKAPDLASSHSSEHEVGSEEYTLQISGPVADEFARVHKAIQKLSRSFVQKFGPMVH